VDRIAYINHDIDDALRAGVLAAGDLPGGPLAILGATGSARIDTLVHDLVEHSAAAGAIVQGDVVGPAMTALRQFMFDRVYLGPEAAREQRKVDFVIRTVFDRCCADPGEIPDSIPDGPLPRRVADHLAGMTDRYCLRAFERITVPASLAA
jgi:dGTPase